MKKSSRPQTSKKTRKASSTSARRSAGTDSETLVGASGGLGGRRGAAESRGSAGRREPRDSQDSNGRRGAAKSRGTPVVQVGIVMGSESDLRVMQLAADCLADFGVGHEVRILSAHRTPNEMLEYAATAEDRGLKVLVAGAGGAAHLPGMIASATVLPVIGVPVNITALDGLDAFLSIVQMPKGVPVATVAIDNATNAALLALRILATSDRSVSTHLHDFRQTQAAKVRLSDARVAGADVGAGAGAGAGPRASAKNGTGPRAKSVAKTAKGTRSKTLTKRSR